MKNIKKLLIILISAVVSINVVSANSCDVRINETSIDPAGFNIVMPTCRWVPDTSNPLREVTDINATNPVLKRKSTYREAYDAGLEVTDVIYNVESADAKEVSEQRVSVPYCSDSNRKVKAHVNVKAWKNLIPHQCSELDRTKCNTYSVNCNWIADPSYEDAGRCELKNGRQAAYWNCDYPEGGWNIADVSPVMGNQDLGCYKSGFQVTIDVTGTPTESQIQEACRTQLGVTYCQADYSTITYSLWCPNYKCEKINVETGACAPSFEVDGQSAYCVNPSQPFPKNVTGNNYKWNKDFNVRNCEHSYSTLQCGYANILIEGAYFGLSDAAMNLALRLWGYHLNEGGFDKTGLANRQVVNGACNTPVYFLNDDSGKRINVYEHMHDYIMEQFYYISESRDTVHLKDKEFIPSYITDPKDNSGRQTFNGSTFEMISCEIFKDRSIYGVSCGNDKTYRVAMELYFNTLFGNKYMINHLDNLYKNEEGTIVPTNVTISNNQDDPNDGKWVIIQYDRKDLEAVMGDEEEISCNPNSRNFDAEKYEKVKAFCKNIVTVYDQYDRPIVSGDADACRKEFGCYKLVRNAAICEEEALPTIIKWAKVKVTKPKSSMSIREYIACGATSENQVMYAYFPEETPGDTDTQDGEEITYHFNYLCGNECTNYQLRGDNDNNCSLDDDNYDTSYKKTISDPSLSCIVNMDASRTNSMTERNKYDMSEIFGVNTNFCRIYCSDSVEYYLADKTSQNSGKVFKYDVRDTNNTYKDSNNERRLLTAVVKQKRQCVSDIYFYNLPKNVDWKTIYGLSDSEFATLEEAYTWTNLYNVLKAKSGNERDRKENLNQIVYDLYNCNLYAENKFVDKHNTSIYKPHDNVVGNVLKNIRNIHRSYDSSTHKYSVKYENNSGVSNTIKYDTGSTVVSYSSNSESPLGKIGKDAYAVKTEVIFNEPTNDIMSGIKYSTNRSLLEYNEQNETYEFSCGSNCRTTEDSNFLDYVIPENVYAYFEVNSEEVFYNKDRYQILPNTGNVTLNTNMSEFSFLDKYSYPIDKYAYNNTGCVNSSDGNKLCPVTQNIKLSPFKRATSSDAFKSAIINGNFGCYVKVDLPEVLGDSDYRQVDLSNLFPSGVSSVSAWNGEKFTPIIEQIEATADRLKQTDDLLEYRVTLTPTQINEIRKFNKDNGAYVNEVVYNCTYDTENNIYRDCKSNFLEKLRQGNEYGTLDPSYSDGVSKYNRNN